MYVCQLSLLQCQYGPVIRRIFVAVYKLVVLMLCFRSCVACVYWLSLPLVLVKASYGYICAAQGYLLLFTNL